MSNTSPSESMESVALTFERFSLSDLAMQTIATFRDSFGKGQDATCSAFDAPSEKGLAHTFPLPISLPPDQIGNQAIYDSTPSSRAQTPLSISRSRSKTPFDDKAPRPPPSPSPSLRSLHFSESPSPSPPSPSLLARSISQPTSDPASDQSTPASINGILPGIPSSVSKNKRKRRLRTAQLDDVALPNKKDRILDAPKQECQPRRSYNARKKSGKKQAAKQQRDYAVDPLLALRVLEMSGGEQLPLKMKGKKMRVTQSAYTGYHGTEPRKATSGKVWSLQELLSEGFEIIEWDGITPKPLTREDGVILGVLAGRPGADSYLESCKAAVQLMKDINHEYGIDPEEDHLRGNFPAIHAGFSYGNGMTQPGPVATQSPRRAEIAKIVQHPAFQRIANFQSSMYAFVEEQRVADYPGSFSTWSPRVYEYIWNQLESLYTWCKERGIPVPNYFPQSVFTMFTVNFGPNTWTFKHRDVMNLAWAWCAITALGEFDASAGGHLILHDFKKAIVFPTGSTILILSAIFAHSNVPISGGWRGSFTQYIPGGLVRWIHAGFQQVKVFSETEPEEYEAWLVSLEENWNSAERLFSNIKTLGKRTAKRAAHS